MPLKISSILGKHPCATHKWRETGRGRREIRTKCVYEREREKEKEKETQRHRETHTHTQRKRERERETERDHCIDSSHRRCSIKKLFLKILLNFEKTFVGVSFKVARLDPNFIKNTSTQMFSCEYCEIFKNNYFEKHLRTAASA